MARRFPSSFLPFFLSFFLSSRRVTKKIRSKTREIATRECSSTSHRTDAAIRPPSQTRTPFPRVETIHSTVARRSYLTRPPVGNIRQISSNDRVSLEISDSRAEEKGLRAKVTSRKPEYFTLRRECFLRIVQISRLVSRSRRPKRETTRRDRD